MLKAYAAAGDTVAISATTTSGFSAIFPHANLVRVVNVGTVASHIAFGPTGVVAATTDLALGPNEVVVLQKGGAAFVAARTASGTATVYVTPVE